MIRGVLDDVTDDQGDVGGDQGVFHVPASLVKHWKRDWHFHLFFFILSTWGSRTFNEDQGI